MCLQNGTIDYIADFCMNPFSFPTESLKLQASNAFHTVSWWTFFVAT